MIFVADYHITHNPHIITISPDSLIDETSEEAFFTLTYENILNIRIVTLYYNNNFFLPIIELFKLLEINYNYDLSGKKLSGFFVDEENKYELNFSKLYYIDKNRKKEFANQDFIITPLEIYVNPELLKQLFGLNFVFNYNELSIKLLSQKNLPIYTRIKREFNYRYIQKKDTIKQEYYIKSTKNLFYGVYFDYFLSSNYTKGLPSFYNYNFGIGGIFLGGATEMSINGSINQKYNVINDFIYNWSYVFNNKNITRISLGTIEYNGLQQSIINGLSITNEPVEPRKSYHNFILSEQCGANWIIELYINDKLTDVTKADANGNFNFIIPMNYGTTFLTLKYYSPSGIYLTSKKLFNIPYKFIPKKEFNYNINFGKVSFKNTLIGQIAGSYGIAEWLTNTAGIEFLKDNNQKKIFLYNEINMRINSSHIFNLILSPNVYYRLNFNALFYSQSTLNLSLTKFYKNPFYNPFNLNNEFQVDIFRPFNFEYYSINIGSSFRLQSSNNFTSKYFSFGIGSKAEYIGPSFSYKYLNTRYKNSYTKQHFITSSILLPLKFVDKWLTNSRANFLTVNAHYDLKKNKLVQYNISYSLNMLSDSRFEINYYNNNVNLISYLQLNFVLNLPFTKMWSTYSHNSLFMNLYGSLVYDINTEHIFFYNRQQIGKSFVLCRPFIDDNNNGRFDYGEQLLDDININLESLCKVEKVGHGLIKIEELNPYTTYTLYVNESYKNPFVFPVYKTIAFQTEINSSKIIDIPFYYGKEVSGHVFLQLNKIKKPLNALKVIFENMDNNTKIYLTTFSDGTFYYTGLKPARYKIYVDPDQLKILNCRSYPEYIEFDFNNSDEDYDFIFELSKL